MRTGSRSHNRISTSGKVHRDNAEMECGHVTKHGGGSKKCLLHEHKR